MTRRQPFQPSDLPALPGRPGADHQGEWEDESTLLLSAIAARWQLRLAHGAALYPVVSSTLVPSELPITVTRRR